MRNEGVRVFATDDGFSTTMARMATSAAVFGGTLDNIDGAGLRIRDTLPQTSREVDGLGRTLRRQSAEVDRFSGRIRIVLDGLAILGPSLVPIGGIAAQAIGGLASQLGFAAIGMGTLVVAAQGVGDALKALNEASLDPTAANLEKAREAMDQLGPAAQTFVRRFQELRPTLRLIRDAAAAGWFPGLTDALDSVERVGPEVAEIFERIGRVGGDLVAEGAGAFAGTQWDDFRDFVATSGVETLDELGRTLGNLTRGLAEMWMAFDPLNRDFSTWLLRISRDFASWADGLAATEGFQEFVAYVRENGPAVADSLGALGDALVQIVEAVAPLGGPSLKIIEAFSTAIAAVADSDLGTPILAGVAALALLNRTLQVTAALQTRLTGSTALAGGMAAGGIFGAGRAGASGLRNAGRDLRVVGDTWRYLGASAALAEAKQSRALTGMAKGTAVAGGLAIAATGAADGIGLSNTASLALMGTVAGPWGAAIGGGVGLMMDFAAAVDTGTSSTESFNAAVASGNVEQMLAEIKAVEQELAGLRDMNSIDGFGDFLGDFASSSKRGLRDAFANVGVGEFTDTAGGLESRRAVLEGQIDAAERAALAEAGFSDAVRKTGQDAGFTTGQLLDLAESTRQSSAAAWGAFDAQTRLGESMDALAAAAAKGKRGIDATTEGGRENRDALSGLASDWLATKTAMEENGDSTKAIEKRYREVRARLIEAATAMTGSRRKAIELASQLEKPMSIVIKEKHAEAISSAKAAIAELRRSIEGKPITQTVNVKINGKNVKATVDESVPLGGGMIPGKADGGLILGPGGPRDDLIPAMLSNKEYVINAAAVAKYGVAFFDAANAQRLASGGKPGKPEKGGGGRNAFFLPFGVELPDVGKGLRGLERALRKSEKALDRESDKRQAIVDQMDSLRSAAADSLLSDLFGERPAWSAGGTYDDVMAMINGDNAAFDLRKQQIAGFKAKGLDGPALDQLLAEGSPEQIAAFLQRSTGELDAYEKAFNQRSSNATAVGNAAANAAYGAELAKQTAATNGVAAEVKVLQQIVKQESKTSRNSTKRGTGKAGRSIKRGT